MAKMPCLSLAHTDAPFRVRADCVVSLEKASWMDANGACHIGTTLTMLTGNAFTVEQATKVVQQMWLAALEE